MTTAMALLFGMSLRGVVDQMDAGVASVEWRRCADPGFVPVALLPPGTSEGDVILIRLRPAGRQPSAALTLPTTVPTRDWRARVTTPRSIRRTP